MSRKNVKKRKKEQADHWLFGRHAVVAALQNPDRIISRLLITEENREYVDSLARTRKVTIETVMRKDLDSILPHDTVHQGIALLTKPLEDISLNSLLIKAENEERSVIVALDQITDPHNIGAILRSAAAFGVAGVITADRHAPHQTGSMAKAASGALETIPFVRVTNLARTLGDLKREGYWCLGLTAHGADSLPQIDLPDRLIVIMGSEGSGLRRLTEEECDLLTFLPMSDEMESLNVSNAAAITLYEIYRKQFSS